jgi:hypothetical protein
MARSTLLMSDYVRISPNSNINIDFKLAAFESSATTGEIVMKVSSSNDFSGASIITPTQILFSDDAGETFQELTSDNIISADDAGTDLIFRFVYAYPNENSIKYMKLTFTEDENSAIDSLPIILTSLNTLDFKLASAITKSQKPGRIKISLKENYINNPDLNIQVLVTNNALDTEPVWEDATTEFNNNEYYIFTNSVKSQTNWGINVRFIITKSSYDTGIEIEEIYLAYD